MNPKVLIVDDEAPILSGIKLNLGRTFDLTLASGGAEAIEAAIRAKARKDGESESSDS